MTSFSVEPETGANKLLNSNNLSIATSIGIHALLLAIILPNLAKPEENLSAKELRNVGVIELNSFEQSRLPSLDPAASSLPAPSANTGTTSPPPLSPLPDLPPLGNLDTGLPPLSSIAPPPSLPSLPPLPSLPSVNIYSPPVASLPSSRSLRTPPIYPSYRPNLPNPPSLPTLPTNNPDATNPVNPLNPRSNYRPNFDPYQDNLTIERLRRAPRNASEQAQEALRNPVAVNSNPNGFSPLNEQRRQQLLDEMQQRMRALDPDGKNTTDEEAMRNQIDWLTRVKDNNPNALNALNTPNSGGKAISIVSLTGTYPVDACSRQLAGTAIYGVTVNGSGTPIGEPQLLKSAGYPILNQQAAREVRLTRLANTGEDARVYQVKVSFAPTAEVCRSSIGRSGSNNNSEGNSRPPSPAAVPQTPPVAPPSPAVSPQPQPSPIPSAEQKDPPATSTATPDLNQSVPTNPTTTQKPEESTEPQPIGSPNETPLTP